MSPPVFLRSLLYNLYYAGITILLTPATLLASLHPNYDYRYRMSRLWCWLLVKGAEKICGIGYRIEGSERIPQTNGIVLSKHQSAWETFLLYLLFPKAVYVLKRELAYIPFFGWCAVRYRHIFVDRKRPRESAKRFLREGGERLRQGHWIILFPEGQRVLPGERVPYAKSGGLLAAKAGVPVVPVALNSGRFWPRRGFFKYPGTVTVRIGEPLDGSRLSAEEINRRAEAWIEAQMAELEGEADGHRPRKIPTERLDPPRRSRGRPTRWSRPSERHSDQQTG